MPSLTSSVTSLPGIGPAAAAKLKLLAVNSVFDLLYHLPFRYEDRSRIFPAAQAQPGEMHTFIGSIDKLKNEYTRRGKIVQTAEISDTSGSLSVVWFNQPFLTRTLKNGSQIALYGKIELFNHKRTLVSPDYELISANHPPLHTARLVPVYPETAGITSKWLRTKIYNLLNTLDLIDFLPAAYSQNFMPWATALRTVHFPDSLAEVDKARRRLAFDELLLLQLLAQSRRQKWQTLKLAHPFAIPSEKLTGFLSTLPFSLTAAQTRVIAEISADLSRPTPMNRLLEGDVGSGKTVIAAVAALVSYSNQSSTLFMAPTQILADQHYQTLSQFFKPFAIPVYLVTASTPAAEKSKIVKSKTKIIVGTHSLLYADFDQSDIGLVIIDEQHRFGVTQRASAVAKGVSPHILTMTATPIPRTIALTLYGDLDLSVLDELPPGRLPVRTWVVPENKRAASYEWIRQQLLSTGRQLFWVCPFIEESESLQTVKAATTHFEHISQSFPNSKVALLHGKQSKTQKDTVISQFRAGDYQILVATPVVEVGIDIPNAALIVIEAAERFGLSQLHQLRGRVGRSRTQSYCLLFTSNDQSTARLKAMENHNSGLELAEIDLRLRGPGDVYGTVQHGLPQFKIATYSDLDLISQAKQAAQTLFPRLPDIPRLRDILDQGKIDLVQPN